jgi:5-formyltetrahydrofolate cyclo-ligase
MTDKKSLRAKLRKRRIEHEAAIPDAVRALLFHRPPAALLDLVPAGATISVYHPTAGEASPLGYARWFAERGHPIALPWFAARGAEMAFRIWENPFDEASLVPDPYGALQPPDNAPEAAVEVAIVPLVGFDELGMRIGQGGGYYDRFLARTPGVVAIGIAWDCQKVDRLPLEPHDMPLRAVITPTRFYGPF